MQREETDLLTTSEVARRLGCVGENVRRLVRIGQLPVALTVGRGQRLYAREEVERLVETRATRKGAV